MALEGAAVYSLTEGSRTWGFCSERCRAVFAADPEAYRREYQVPAPA